MRFLKSGENCTEKSWIFKCSEQKVSIIVDVSNCMEMYFMLDDTCMTLVFLSTFLLCNACATSSLLMGVIFSTINCFCMG